MTSIRVPAANFQSEGDLRAVIEKGLREVSRESGFVFSPVRQQMLASATGTTPFDMLFLSLSSFVIVAALMLVTLLFKLSVQQRTAQIGLLYSQGFTTKRVRGLLLSEFLIVSLLGGLIGVPLGLGYAKLMIVGLESWWVGAISTKFLTFSFTPSSLLIGVGSGVFASLITILFSLRKIASAAPLTLLRGTDIDTQTSRGRKSAAGWAAPAIIAVAAFGLSLLAASQTGMGRAGCFFGVGMLLLLSAWLAVRQILIRQPTSSSRRHDLRMLAAQAIRRNPVRSSLSIGLLAVASFLIASLGVFRMSPSKTGYGGFDLIAISSQPIYENIGSPAARKALIGDDAEKMRGAVVMPMRMREGDDASCNNLYQTKAPTILGVIPSLQNLTESVADYEFAWAASARPNSPWDALNQYGTGAQNQPIPVILDQNTAMWSLKQGGSIGSSIVIEIDGNPTYFRVVGLLNNSILQGKLLVAEQNFQVMFQKISGYRFFIIRSGSKCNQGEITIILESGLSAAGMDVQSSVEVLEKLLGVQNTYISAFQSLGALGLLLGTIGLVAVQLRSVWERRKELALMQAVGFSKLRIGNLLTIETTVLLGLGIAIGIIAATVALIPFVLQVGPELSLLQPLGMLAVVFACGFLSAVIAIRFALRLPLLASLRSE
ncbi:MAG: ABC transporter permease [Pirellulales bacterium]